MPTPSRPRIYQPRTRAEAIAPLDQVKQACREDPQYLAALVQVAADVLLEANSKTEPAVPGESTEARARRAIMSQFATRGAA